MISLFLAHMKLEVSIPDNLPRFALFIGGFLPRDETITKHIIQGEPSMDSLHIYGSNDDLVRTESRSQKRFSVY